VGFLLSKPRDYIAALSSLGSILPDPSVSKRLNASLISSISSSVSPGLSIAFFYLPATGLVTEGFAFDAILRFILKFILFIIIFRYF